MAVIIIVDANTGRVLDSRNMRPGTHVVSYPGYSSQAVSISQDDESYEVALTPRFRML